MSSTYIIGDVHGNYNGLVESLQKMGWKENEDKLIFVGDLFHFSSKQKSGIKN